MIAQAEASVLIENVLIREATPDDARSCSSMMRGILLEVDHHLFITLDELDEVMTVRKDHIQQITQNTQSLMLVAESLTSNQIVGVLICENQVGFAKKHIVQLEVMIHRDWRGKGIGSRLIEEAKRWAQRHDTIRRIEAEVLVKNRRAAKLLSRLGFRPEARLKEAIRKGNQYLDCYLLALNVAKG